MLFLLFCFFCLTAYKSMPYSLHTHSTAPEGSMWLVGFTPKQDNRLRFSLSQRWKVLRLTPAASANSYLYALFMYFFYLWYEGTNKPTYAREKQQKTQIIAHKTDRIGQRVTAPLQDVVPLQWNYKIHCEPASARDSKNPDFALLSLKRSLAWFKNEPQLGAQLAEANSRIRSCPSPDLPQRGGEEVKKQPNLNS